MCIKHRPSCSILALAICWPMIAQNCAAATTDELDELLVEYRAAGLPEPPPHARLVRFWAGVTSNGRQHHLGFWIKPKNEGDPQTILVGTRMWQVEKEYEKTIEFIEPDKAVLDGPNSKWTVRAQWYGSTFWINSSIATAIQCRARGWSDLAAKLLTRSLTERCGDNRSLFYQHANQPPKTALAEMAWAHWGNELVTPGTDRSAILLQMQRLVSGRESFNTERNRRLLEGLAATVKPSGAQPGSVEAAIDGLTEVTGYCPRWWHVFAESDPHFLNVLELGFDAIPGLIDHLDDRRLTRAILSDPMSFATQPLTVGEVASQVLEGIRDHRFTRKNVAGRAEWYIDKDEALAWWNGLKQTGEEQFAVQNVLSHEHGTGPANMYLLWIVAKKYPKRLCDIYNRLLDELPGIHGDDIAKHIRNAPIDNAIQIEMFVKGARHKSLKQRLVALTQLVDLDRARFVELLVKTLDELPHGGKDSRPCSMEASFASLVAATDSAEAWAALDRAVRRSGAGMRIEFLDRLDRIEPLDRQRTEGLKFLASFLDDAEVRKADDIPAGAGGCCYAASQFDRLEVRNLAAMSLANLLKLDDRPNPAWSLEQWAALRSKVRDALKTELLPPAN